MALFNNLEYPMFSDDIGIEHLVLPELVSTSKFQLAIKIG